MDFATLNNFVIVEEYEHPVIICEMMDCSWKDDAACNMLALVKKCIVHYFFEHTRTGTIVGKDMHT